MFRLPDLLKSALMACNGLKLSQKMTTVMLLFLFKKICTLAQQCAMSVKMKKTIRAFGSSHIRHHRQPGQDPTNCR
jgi:hypothetical protein